jgi:hypothetical protein
MSKEFGAAKSRKSGGSRLMYQAGNPAFCVYADFPAPRVHWCGSNRYFGESKKKPASRFIGVLEIVRQPLARTVEGEKAKALI